MKIHILKADFKERRRERRGPNTEPCGTLYFTGRKSDLFVRIQTSRSRFDKKEETKCRMSLEYPYRAHFRRRRP